MTVILVAHILVSLVLIVVVLMQRSEGGALGIGGGGGGGAGGGLMSGRGVAGALVRTTIVFGAIFFVTSLVMTTIATRNDRGGITEIQEELNEDFGTRTEDGGLNIEGLGNVRDPDITISDDPLATPSADPIVEPGTEPAIEDGTSDPLADPQ